MDGNKREYIEWTNSWIEGGDKKDLPRVLLLGDSIVSANRDSVQNELVDKFYIDKMATSRSLDQNFYWKQLDLFLSDTQAQYDIILFNFGLHGFHIPTEEYGYLLNILANRLKETNAKLCYMLTTPIVNFDNNPELEIHKGLVLERNEIAIKVMANQNIEVFDQYTPVLGKMEIRIPNDYYHYNEKGQKLQGEIISKKIIELYNK